MTTKNELTEEQIKGSYFDYTLEVKHLTLKNAHSFGMKAGYELGRKGQGERVEALEAKIDELFATINDCFVEVGSIGHKASRVVKKLNEAASMPLPESPGE